LAQFVSMDRITDNGWEEERIAFLDELLDKPLVSGAMCRDIPAHVFDNIRLSLPIWSFTMLAAVFAATLPVAFLSVGLTVRTATAYLIERLPPTSSILYWGRAHGVRRSNASASSRQELPAYDDIVLELPPPKRRRTAGGDDAPAHSGRSMTHIDPIRMIKSLTLSTLLRAQQDFKKALAAARGIDAAGSDDDAQAPDDAVSRSSLLRGFGRVDVTELLLRRREWHADVVHDTIDQIVLLTDASPNSGLEFQGMVAVVGKKDGSFDYITLPGSTLVYGLMDSVSKTVALLWAIWLLCGPDVSDVLYFLNHVTCVTTDSGVELGTVETPNILYAFMQWVAGVPFQEIHSFVRPKELLLPVAIRISGWSHGFGNLSKGAAWTWRQWPQKLELVRMLVRWFKNRTWRNHTKKALRGRDDVDLRILDRSVHDLAKLRYQTLNDVTGDLLIFSQDLRR